MEPMEYEPHTGFFRIFASWQRGLPKKNPTRTFRRWMPSFMRTLLGDKKFSDKFAKVMQSVCHEVEIEPEFHNLEGKKFHPNPFDFMETLKHDITILTQRIGCNFPNKNFVSF